jgi:uncharacterized membrane protein
LPGGKQAEVNDIAKQRFLAELDKLLTFMYEEDRQTALAMYSKMFDDAEDEEELSSFLGSATRQAVIVARAYNARARKLQVESQSREQDGAEAEATPDFVLAIDELYRQFFPSPVEADQVLADQVSLFDEHAQPDQAAPAAPPPAEPAQGAAETAADTEEDAEKAESGSTEQAVEKVFEDADPAAGIKTDEVDRFLEDYRPEGETLDAEPAPDRPENEPAREVVTEEVSDEPAPVRKPRVFLLILYILLAIPITLAGVVLLLIPTLLFLVLAVACVAAGAALLVAAFSGFTMLADFLLLFGGAVVLLALGLLFLWIFVWFIAGAIAGMIAGVIQLGRSWCYKEVAA